MSNLVTLVAKLRLYPKHFTKILLIALAIVGLAIGISSVASYNNSTGNINTTVFAENDINNTLMDNNVVQANAATTMLKHP